MHGNTPYAGSTDGAEVSTERRRALRRELVDVATSTRDLLSDEFVVGGEIADADGALRATVAVQPPVGSVVSAGVGAADGGTEDVESVARDLAAGAVREARRAGGEVHRAAR